MRVVRVVSNMPSLAWKVTGYTPAWPEAGCQVNAPSAQELERLPQVAPLAPLSTIVAPIGRTPVLSVGIVPLGSEAITTNPSGAPSATTQLGATSRTGGCGCSAGVPISTRYSPPPLTSKRLKK